MVEISSEADIQCSAETIFDLIIDFRGQDRWLTESSAFHGTSEISCARTLAAHLIGGHQSRRLGVSPTPALNDPASL
jgi:hypothetical protein